MPKQPMFLIEWRDMGGLAVPGHVNRVYVLANDMGEAITKLEKDLGKTVPSNITIIKREVLS